MSEKKLVALFLISQVVLIGIIELIASFFHFPLTFFSLLYMTFPFIGVILVNLFFEKKIHWNYINFKSMSFSLLAVLIPLFVFVLSILISLVVEKDSSLSLGFEGLTKLGLQKVEEKNILFLIKLVVKAVLLGATINAFFSLFEEIAWRGWLYEKLKRCFPDGIKAELIIGVIWGCWHIPLIAAGLNYPGYPVIGGIIMIVWCISVTPIMCFLKDKTNSVLPSAIMHGVINGLAGISLGLIDGGNSISTGMMGIPGLLSFIFIDILLFFCKKLNNQGF